MNSEQIARVKINPNIRPFTKMDQLLVAKPTHLFKMTVFAGYHDGAKISARTAVVQTNGPTYGVMVRYFQNIERFLDSKDPNALEMPGSTDVVDPNALTFVPARLLEALKDKRVQTRWDRRFLPFTQVADFPLNENERLLGLAMARLDPKYPIDALEVASSMLGNFTVVGSGHPQLS